MLAGNRCAFALPNYLDRCDVPLIYYSFLHFQRDGDLKITTVFDPIKPVPAQVHSNKLYITKFATGNR